MDLTCDHVAKLDRPKQPKIEDLDITVMGDPTEVEVFAFLLEEDLLRSDLPPNCWQTVQETEKALEDDREQTTGPATQANIRCVKNLENFKQMCSSRTLAIKELKGAIEGRGIDVLAAVLEKHKSENVRYVSTAENELNERKIAYQALEQKRTEDSVQELEKAFVQYKSCKLTREYLEEVKKDLVGKKEQTATTVPQDAPMAAAAGYVAEQVPPEANDTGAAEPPPAARMTGIISVQVLMSMQIDSDDDPFA